MWFRKCVEVVSEMAGVRESGCWLSTSGWAWLQWSWPVITSVFSDRETPFSSSSLLCWWNAAMSEGNAESAVRRGKWRFFCKCLRKTVRKEDTKRKRHWSTANGILNEVWEEPAHNPVNHRTHSCHNSSDILLQLHISHWQINKYSRVRQTVSQCISGGIFSGIFCRSWQ